jgi:hypothetical protein
MPAVLIESNVKASAPLYTLLLPFASIIVNASVEFINLSATAAVNAVVADVAIFAVFENSDDSIF